MLSKGAESTMLAACVSGDLASTEQHITSLASLGTGGCLVMFPRHCILCPGLRTLVLGHKTISEEQWTAFSLALDTTNQSLVNR